MRIISRRTLVEFWSKHPTAKPSLESWYAVVKAKTWRHFSETRQTYASADQVKVASGRTVTVFNVGGNNERVITAIHYNTQIVFVLLVLTHAEYAKKGWKCLL